jgi:hypothetical protein
MVCAPDKMWQVRLDWMPGRCKVFTGRRGKGLRVKGSERKKIFDNFLNNPSPGSILLSGD